MCVYIYIISTTYYGLGFAALNDNFAVIMSVAALNDNFAVIMPVASTVFPAPATARMP